MKQSYKMNTPNCSCGSPNSYSNCCEIAHVNILQVDTAEALMRSRYTAFVKANINYLSKSWHSTTRPTSKNELGEILDWTASVIWERLEIVNTTKGTAFDTEGTVEFKAYYFEGVHLKCIHENSYFSKEEGYWVYVGEAP